MANLLDFIKDYRHVLKVNGRISVFFMFYILINFIASLLGPSTVLLMITDTFQVAFDLNIWLAYFCSMSPVVLFILVCFTFKNDTQITIAAMLSSIFAVVMIMVIMGTISRTLNTSILSPSSLIMYSLVFIFLLAGILHPSEFKCLFPGFMYFLCLPSAFVFLNIYAISNLNNISWGTREIVKPPLEDTNPTKVRGKGILEFVQKFFRQSGQLKQDPENNCEEMKDLIDSLNR